MYDLIGALDGELVSVADCGLVDTGDAVGLVDDSEMVLGVSEEYIDGGIVTGLIAGATPVHALSMVAEEMLLMLTLRHITRVVVLPTLSRMPYILRPVNTAPFSNDDAHVSCGNESASAFQAPGESM